MGENNDIEKSNNYTLLIGFADLMIITSCGILIACVAGTQTLAFSVAVGLNAISIVILREWVMSILNIHANISWLNLFLKRIISMTTGIVISVTLLPIALVIAFVATKRHSAGPVLLTTKLHSTSGREICCLTFRPAGSFINKGIFSKLPLALNLITGPLSLWNISSYKIQQPAIWEQIEENIKTTQNTETTYNYEHTEKTIWQDEN